MASLNPDSTGPIGPTTKARQYTFRKEIANPLRRGEQKAQELRKAAKATKLQSKRYQVYQRHSQPLAIRQAKNAQVKVLLLNVRGMNSTIKQFAIKGLIQSTNADIVGLTETRLKHSFKMKDTHSIQSKFDQKGGVWCTSTKSKQVRNIKYVANTITYQSIAYYSCPIHTLTCYLSPVQEDAIAVRKTIQHLKAMISNIFSTFKNSKVIVMGDFNTKWTPEINIFLKRHGLEPVLPVTVATHNQGGQLDNIYTNLSCTSYLTQPINFSDHLAVIANLEFIKTPEDLDLTRIPVKHSQHTLRKVATSQTTKQLILENPETLTTPLRNSIAPQLPTKGRVSHWYKKPPDWFLLQEPNGGKELACQRDEEWAKLMHQVEHAYADNQGKHFHTLVRKACQLKKTGNPIKGLLIDGEHCFSDHAVEAEVVRYYSELYKQNDVKQSLQMSTQSNPSNNFKREEIEDAMSRCNFEKGIGPDAFDGRILQDPQVKQIVAEFLCRQLNQGQIPDYITEGRLVLLSKGNQQSVVPVEETRPIVVNSHLQKIYEKAIELKLNQWESKLFHVDSYQSGFKQSNSTHSNIVKLLNSILIDNRKKKNKEAFILVDLRKAYDSVNRNILFEILAQKAKNQEEKFIVELIRILGSKNKIYYQNSFFLAQKGVVQGGILSPKLFNVYLDYALRSNKVLSDLITNNRLIAFADDILIKVTGKSDFAKVIKALEELNESFGLQLNRKKSVFLSNNAEFKQMEDFEGIKKVTSAKYLGVMVSLSKNSIKCDAKARVKQILEVMKGRLRIKDHDCLNAIYTAYLRSLITYFLTPIVACNAMTTAEIDYFEASIKRKLLRIPNDIKSEGENFKDGRETSRTGTTKGITLAKTHFDFQITHRTYRKAPLQQGDVERSIIDLMIATTQHRTVLNYNKLHYCTTHQKNVDRHHIRSCSHLAGVETTLAFNQEIQEHGLCGLTKIKQIIIIALYRDLRDKLNTLEQIGTYTVIEKEQCKNAQANKEASGNQNQRDGQGSQYNQASNRPFLSTNQ